MSLNAEKKPLSCGEVLRQDAMVIFGGSSGIRRHNDTFAAPVSADFLTYKGGGVLDGN